MECRIRQQETKRERKITVMMTTNVWLSVLMMSYFRVIYTKVHIVYHFQQIDQHNRLFQDRFDHMENEVHRKNLSE